MTTVIVIVAALARGDRAPVREQAAAHRAERRLSSTSCIRSWWGSGSEGSSGPWATCFAADKVAEQLGWATGSPFQTEVGLFDLAFGVLGDLLHLVPRPVVVRGHARLDRSSP